MTLRERLLSEDFNFAFNNLIDDFNRCPNYDLVSDNILDIENLNSVQKSLISALVDELCTTHNIRHPEWIFSSECYLSEPYFALNAKGKLRIVLLSESPSWYRSRNLFVSRNCSERV